MLPPISTIVINIRNMSQTPVYALNERMDVGDCAKPQAKRS